MESRDDATTATTAARLLQQQEEVRSRLARRGPSRGYQWLLVCSAVLLSAYVGVFLHAFSGFDPASAGPGGYTYTNLMLLPVLLYSVLVNGARERFGIRTRASVAQAVGSVAAIVAFVVLGSLSIAGVGYPGWLNVVAPAVLFAVMAIAPIRRLFASRSAPPTDRWANTPLTVPARWATAGIGVVLGLLAATTTVVWFPIISAATLLVTLSVVLISWRLQWGLRSTGFQWGPVNWVLFAVATAALFALAAALSTSYPVTEVVAVAVGVFVLVVMTIAALLPFAAADE
jgi:hypothetical protein